MEQATLFALESSGTAEDLAAHILPLLEERVIAHWGDPTWIRTAEKKGFISLYFLNEGNLIARIRMGKKSKRIEIRGSYWRLIPEALPSCLHYVKIRNKDGEQDEHLDYCYIYLDDGWREEMGTMLQSVIDSIFSALPCDYSCCSSYNACSDAMRCLHPGELDYLSCSYRKKLFSGISFFGHAPTI